MRLLSKIADAKIPLRLRRALNSECPLGNASLLPYKDEKYYLCSFREFTYDIQWNEYKYQQYRRSTPNAMWFALVDNNFTVESSRFKSVAYCPDERDKSYANQDFEDARLFRWNSEIYVSTTVDRNDKKLYCPYTKVMKLTDDNWEIRLNTVFNSYFHPHCAGSPTKNWMAVPDKPFNMIHKVNHHHMEVIDVDKNTIWNTYHYNNVTTPWDMRGNTNLLKVGNNYLALTHTIPNHKHYVSYFLVMDQNLEVKYVSKDFLFDTVSPIEMSISMFYLNRMNEQKIGITVCEDDCFQYVYVVDREKLVNFIFEGAVT